MIAAACKGASHAPENASGLGHVPMLVMAVGNILRQDDGFADAVLKALAAQDLPAGVELFDAGTSIIDLMDVFHGRERLIVIDAVQGGQAPGTLYRFSPEEVEAEAIPTASLHQVGLLETLKLGELVDCRPKATVVIGVQPASTALGIGLTPEVAAAVPEAVRLVKKELGL
ncbi:hydrogenase maturation protease [Geoalkalibacter ferrihydriticus]|nr:hydrogenase maturation protease [Geoalkalibacter ferrihydriticus]SDM53195.1 hydrogenase maturation protease [Geoalkalibacter ferrihydriticus]